MDTRRLYQQIADRLRALIHEGQFVAGSRLPAERDLATQLGISRPSLREALIALELDGSVEVRMGSGIYVLPTPERPLLMTRAFGESPSELMQARALIEGAVVVMACPRLDDAALRGLRGHLTTMRSAVADGRKPLESDRDFHLAIAGHAGNAVMTGIVAALFDERHSPISIRLSAHFETPETWAGAIAEHETICDALEARDPMLAQAAMHMHLQASRERWAAL